MSTLWNPEMRTELRVRLAELPSDRAPRWGKMSAPAMAAHLRDALRMTIGELAVQPRKLPLRWPVVKQLVIYVAPFPKGAPTAPELLSGAPAEAWTDDVSAIGSLLGRFAERDRKGAWPVHPAFGRLSGDDWGVLQYRHCDHHLRQFGG